MKVRSSDVSIGLVGLRISASFKPRWMAMMNVRSEENVDESGDGLDTVWSPMEMIVGNK